MKKLMLALLLVAAPVGSAVLPVRRLPLLGVRHCLAHGCAYHHCP
jgi:hypothetical protein